MTRHQLSAVSSSLPSQAATSVLVPCPVPSSPPDSTGLASRQRGRHIALADYRPEEIAEEHIDINLELAAIAGEQVPGNHIVAIDCPDCGRTIAYNGRCRKCGGASWIPAGHFDRMKLREFVQRETEEQE